MTTAQPSTTAAAAKLAADSSLLVSLREQLDLYKKKFENESTIGETVQELIDFQRSYKDTEAFKQFEESSDFVQYQESFCNSLLKYALANEEKTYKRLLTQTHNPDRKLGELLDSHAYINAAYIRMEETLEFMDYAACNEFVIIGAGRVPASLFYLHDYTDIPRLVGIDNDTEAVTKAQQLVGLYSLQRINIAQAEGISYDYGNADIIYISCFALPREGILHQIKSTAKRSVKVIIQQPYHTGSLTIVPTLNELGSSFYVSVMAPKPHPLFMVRHYVLSLTG